MSVLISDADIIVDGLLFSIIRYLCMNWTLL